MSPSHSGSAHAGLGEWLVQRLSAVYMAGFTVYVVLRLGLWPIRDFAAWQAWCAGGGVRVAAALFVGSTLVHAWIGMRSVYLDYAKPFALRLTLGALTGFGLLACALWAAALLIAAGRA